MKSFRNGKPVSDVSRASFTKVIPEKSLNINNPSNGIKYFYYEGNWEMLPDFNSLISVKEGTTQNFDISLRNQNDYFGFRYNGYIMIPDDDVYTFYTDSDDGSKLFIDDKLIVDNDGLHGMQERKGMLALSKGFHKIEIQYFERSGGNDLKVSVESSKIKKQNIPDNMLFH